MGKAHRSLATTDQLLTCDSMYVSVPLRVGFRSYACAGSSGYGTLNNLIAVVLSVCLYLHHEGSNGRDDSDVDGHHRRPSQPPRSRFG